MQLEEKKKPLDNPEPTLSVLILAGTTQIIVLEFEKSKGHN